MADGFKAIADTSSVLAGLDKLTGPIATHLARSMAVAGGQVLRDEAKLLAPVDSGLLQSAIYLAFKEAKSNDEGVTYSVTWNAKKAPHGHLLEFGHWQYYAAYIGPDGEWHTNKAHPLANPRWVPAHPFLRPALDSAGPRAQAAMIERGRQRLPELLAGEMEDAKLGAS
ncbi:phage domain-containing protein 2 [Mizugakiibacter sediminis]|uniref:Phage domain-containing protein 2 n=1 Tax=Mizugakiibacter sediminis TaxID=1475481 RepID=A0A0K8QQ32_9GAMM|nr:HK97-gp10 family putative phage morphogenesis protein [Mizugakiibacter sediminis]GAP66796.1 phage domain-containing protein 2 [Mizugakiibacter sediminis]